MSLAYNPGDYDIDLRYLKGYHKQDIISYKKARFPSNSDEIRVMMQNLVKGYIGNMSNIYNAGVEYVGLDSEKFKKMLRRKSRAMKMMEKLYNFQNMCLLWTYLVDGEFYFMALDASNFYISYSDLGEIDATIVRTGSFLNDQNETLYHFKMWKNGVIYSQIAKEWGLIDASLSSWQLNNDHSTYTVLPFTTMKEESINIPIRSTLVDLENEAVSGDALALMSILKSLIVKIIISTDNYGPLIQSMINELGIMNMGAVIGERDKVAAMEQADTDNHMNYKEYVEKVIMFRGQIDGVDKQALFPKNVVESGVAKRMEMGNINQMRTDKIVEWKEFEDEHWLLMNRLLVINMPTDYIFAPLPNMIDITEQADIDQKKWATIQSKWQGGVLTAEEYVRAGNPEADDATVKMLVADLSGRDDEILLEDVEDDDIDQVDE